MLTEGMVVTACEHLQKKHSKHIEHFGLLVQMVVNIVITLVTELHLFQVDFNSNVRHVDIFESDWLLQSVGASISNVSESIQEFLSPVFEQRLVLYQRPPSILSDNLPE